MVRGYSYVQMLMVITLLAILAAVASPYYLSWQQRQAVRSTSSMVLADLRFMQSRSMQREQDTTWGIVIDDAAKQYTLTGNYNQTVSYPDSIMITAIPSPTIVFVGLTGLPTAATTIAITSTSLPSATKTITINAEGVMEY